MSSRLVAVTFDAHDPERLATFWVGLLGRQVVSEDPDALLPADGTQVGLRFVEASTEKAGPNRVHLHLTSASLSDQQRNIATALRLGGRHLDVGQLPEEDHVVIGDPEDNEFCVIGPGNSFLAGCGHLAEVSCDGSREVGLFWRDALGWPLVWDQGGETAVQSPAGGTKVSWGGEPATSTRTRARQRFELAAVDLTTEVARLVALGATRRGARDGGVELIDPDGHEFWVRSDDAARIGAPDRP
jgi:hypothetical protein